MHCNVKCATFGMACASRPMCNTKAVIFMQRFSRIPFTFLKCTAVQGRKKPKAIIFTQTMKSCWSLNSTTKCLVLTVVPVLISNTGNYEQMRIHVRQASSLNMFPTVCTSHLAHAHVFSFFFRIPFPWFFFQLSAVSFIAFTSDARIHINFPHTNRNLALQPKQ